MIKTGNLNHYLVCVVSDKYKPATDDGFKAIPFTVIDLIIWHWQWQ